MEFGREGVEDLREGFVVGEAVEVRGGVLREDGAHDAVKP